MVHKKVPSFIVVIHTVCNIEATYNLNRATTITIHFGLPNQLSLSSLNRFSQICCHTM